MNLWVFRYTGHLGHLGCRFCSFVTKVRCAAPGGTELRGAARTSRQLGLADCAVVQHVPSRSGRCRRVELTHGQRHHQKTNPRARLRQWDGLQGSSRGWASRPAESETSQCPRKGDAACWIRANTNRSLPDQARHHRPGPGRSRLQGRSAQPQARQCAGMTSGSARWRSRRRRSG